MKEKRELPYLNMLKYQVSNKVKAKGGTISRFLAISGYLAEIRMKIGSSLH